MWVLGALLVVSFTSGYIIESDEPTESIIWPTEYYFKGEKRDLAVGIVQPFEVWFSAEINRSRIDFYNGLVKTFYYGETDEDFGYTFKIFSKTTEDLTVFEECDVTPRDKIDEDITDFLPDVEDVQYTYIGEAEYNRVVKVWKSSTTDDDGVIEHTLYVYREDSGIDIPVFYETKSYNEWTRALTDHTATYYYTFELPDSNAFNVSNYYDFELCEKETIGQDLKKALHFYHPDISSELDHAFDTYKYHHKRDYSGKEHEMRKTIFQRNWKRVIEHNQKNLSFKMAINSFSDRTEQELAYLTATLPSPQGVGTMEFPHTEEELKTLVDELPENYDMRLEGVISNVKHQGNCGSCWAFSTTAAVEGALARNNGGRNIDLSEQSLVDCAWGYNNYGCSGGFIDSAFKYIIKNGIPSQREYGPYLAVDGQCSLKNVSEVQKVKGFARVPPLSVNAMKYALYKYGPVTVAIYVGDAFKMYSSGVFFDPECKTPRINHGVTVVGYGVRDGVTYWIVKNSWGEDWGQDGYILMSTTNDNCNVLTEAYYPIV